MINHPSCKLHQGFAYQFINLQKGNVKLVCGECLYSSQDHQNKVDFSQIISIEKALNQPDTLLEKLTGQEKFSKFFLTMTKNNGQELMQFVNQIEIMVSQFFNYMNELLKKIKDHINMSIESRGEIIQKILENIQYQKFIDLLKELVNENRKAECEEFELRLSNYVSEIQQGDGLNQNLTQMIKNRQVLLLEDLEKKIELNKIVQFQNEIKQSVEKLNETIKRNYQTEFFETVKSSILAPDDLQQLIEKVQSKKVSVISKLSPIYESVKDGLNLTNFWNKVDNKDNLLFIVRSNTKKVFGAFSPCKWQLNLNKYQLDNNLESFIFIQNPDQNKSRFSFYPLKDTKQQYAIYCSKDGPCFGSGFDLQISKDFKKGFLKVGQCYHIDEQNVNPSCNSNNEIAEIEIYQVI